MNHAGGGGGGMHIPRAGGDASRCLEALKDACVGKLESAHLEVRRNAQKVLADACLKTYCARKNHKSYCASERKGLV